MKIYSYEQARDDLDRILSREGDPGEGVGGIVSDIITDVRRRGDAALVDYTKKFDGAEIDSLRVTPEEIAEARAQLGPELLTAYEDAAANIRSFHEKQLEETWTYEARPGVTLGQKITPLRRAGIYVPGGKASYPSTVLMNAIPPSGAGGSSIATTTPPDRSGKNDAPPPGGPAVPLTFFPPTLTLPQKGRGNLNPLSPLGRGLG